MKFTELGLSAPILQAVAEQGYETPSPIQAQAIPAVLEGKDIMAAAQTGTGKTAGFTLPLLELLSKGPKAQGNQARALVLTPTRELAAQVGESVALYGKNLPLKSAVVFGGVKINPQMMKLRKGVDILVATPGRLMDLYNQNAVNFKQLEVLVLDEADRMLDMGFIRDIKKILAILPKQRQNLLFSATFSNEIRELAKGLVHNPVEISVTPRNAAAKTVTQAVYPVDKTRKTSLLIQLIKENNWRQVLVFSKTKHGANRLTKQLDAAGIAAAAIHGNKSQGARTKALANFKDGSVQVLVATDIAARGIDIDQLPHVVNYELPHVSEDYVHRIGRTGRAGAEGEAVSLVCADEFKLLADIERLIQALIPRKSMAGFEPVHPLPESRLNTKPFKAKKPKKPHSGHRDGQRSGEMAQGHQAPGQRSRANANSDGNNAAKPNNNRRRKPSNKPAGGGNGSQAPQNANRPRKANPNSGRPQRSGAGGSVSGNR
ncbi:DEAD/DEAH box helicase [Dasania sp. GY-MA-18]|uniref:ATP-dependent RNA helicase RhlE n=1 Tax=Dasania phycosphaerae TaxID=2950436 RepID=A0A9J6RHH2_9GAMM|nr:MULTISPECIES: DEAD/DEAH box helicase [Dasania]MCR8921357.1 DEAD/DEAH box helicase [Dasania sp. GY-MA-18]MCZ0863785.1 DEAD/DEAH box helicase [Dasania phycosphaerae]MCZ0867513.1 DEAD/DEAH box helicase [Dasania phycosphaerae]